MTPTVSSGLRDRTIRGFLLFGVQRVVSLLVTAGGGILLARLLTPNEFGLYAILLFAVGLGVTFSDLGLGAALIQRRDLDPVASLGVAFTANLALAIVLGAAIAALAPLIARWLGVPTDVTTPLRALAVLVVLSSLRMPAAVLLERQLAYLPLTIAETADTVVFYCVAVASALAGAGLLSFVFGAVAARVAGLAVLWSVARWKPILRWRWADLAPVLKFGMFSQGSAIISLARDAVVPVFVAAWSGIAAVGFLNWAAALAFLPLQLVSIAGKVMFPALSRLQGDAPRFADATERVLNRVAVILYPVVLLLLAGADPIVRLIYGERWLPAVPAIRLFCVTALVGGTSNILVHTLYSLGRADLVFRWNIVWAALVWGLTVAMVPWLGFIGFAVASACVAGTGVFMAMALRRLVPIRILPPLRVPLAAGVTSALVFAGLTALWIHDIPSLLIGGVASMLTYVGLAGLCGGAAWRVELMADLRTVLEG